MNNRVFNLILNEALEFEVGPDENGKTSVFTKKDVMTSHMTRNKAAAPTVEKKWVKVDKNAQPETWKAANAAYKKAKELGVADKIAAKANTKTADFEIDPITDAVEINFDNGGSINAGPLTESTEKDDFDEAFFENVLARKSKLTEGFVVSEDNNEVWFDQDAFSSFVADSLEINKEDVNGFNVCKEHWFDHDTCDYYTPVLSKKDLIDYVRNSIDASLLGKYFRVITASLEGETLIVEIPADCGVQEDKLDCLYIGPFHCVDFEHGRYTDFLVFEPADDVAVDLYRMER